MSLKKSRARDHDAILSALTSTRFLQHSQTSAASLKSIVEIRTNTGAKTSAIKFQAKSCHVTKCAGPGAAGPTGVVLRVQRICAACCCCYWATCPTTTLCITALLWQNLVFAFTEGLTITWESAHTRARLLRTVASD